MIRSRSGMLPEWVRGPEPGTFVSEHSAESSAHHWVWLGGTVSRRPHESATDP